MEEKYFTKTASTTVKIWSCTVCQASQCWSINSLIHLCQISLTSSTAARRESSEHHFYSFLPSKSLFSERIQNLSWVKVLTVLRLSWSQTPGLVTSWPTLMKECSSWMWSWLLLLMMPILSPVLEMENMLLASERFDALNKHHFIVTFMIQMSLAIPESNGLEEQSVVIFTSNNIKPSDSAVFSYDIGNNTESTTPPPTTSTTPYISPDEVLLKFI